MTLEDERTESEGETVRVSKQLLRLNGIDAEHVNGAEVETGNRFVRTNDEFLRICSMDALDDEPAPEVRERLERLRVRYSGVAKETDVKLGEQRDDEG